MLLAIGLNNINISFLGCKFIANQAFLGGPGGLSVKISGRKDRRAENIRIEVTDSTFEQNGCDEKHGAGFGGGANLTFNTHF